MKENTDHRGWLAAPKLVNEAHHVRNHTPSAVIRNSLRLGGGIVATQVGCHHVVSSFNQRLKLVLPNVPEVRKAVDQHNLKKQHIIATALEKLLKFEPSSRASLAVREILTAKMKSSKFEMKWLQQLLPTNTGACFHCLLPISTLFKLMMSTDDYLSIWTQTSNFKHVH